MYLSYHFHKIYNEKEKYVITIVQFIEYVCPFMRGNLYVLNVKIVILVNNKGELVKHSDPFPLSFNTDL